MSSASPPTAIAALFPQLTSSCSSILTNSSSVLSLGIPEVAECDQLCPPKVLASFLAPIPAPTFLSTIFRKKVLSIHGGGMARLQTLIHSQLSGCDLASLLRSSTSDSIFCWSKAADGSIVSIETSSVERALSCYDAGASLVFRSSAKFCDTFVRCMAADVGMSFGAAHIDGVLRVEGEMFAAKAGHVTEWHIDYMDNFTIHLKGRKRWLMKQGKLFHPLRGASSHYKGIYSVEKQANVHCQQDPDFTVRPSDEWLSTDVDIVDLRAGDVMYHNAGVWHRVETMEDSLSINMSLTGSRWADATASVVRHLLWRDEQWRSMIQFDPASAPSYPTVDDMLARLSTLLSHVMPENVAPPALIERGSNHFVSWDYRFQAAVASPLPTMLTTLRINPISSLTCVSSSVDVTEYALRLAMGNGDLEPLHQFNVIVPSSLQPAMDVLCKATASSSIPCLLSSELVYSGVTSTDSVILTAVLSMLRHHGLCTLQT